jgi:peptidoglycan L-alanyl-D-glutamate endopeptidase CwlK
MLIHYSSYLHYSSYRMLPLIAISTLFGFPVFPRQCELAPRAVASACDDPVIDSSMTMKEAVRGVAMDCPKDILASLKLVTVRYYGFDAKLHQGQVVVHKDLAKDIERVFAAIEKERFPIQSVIPISDKRFKWDDDASMRANNTSAFNYRVIAGTMRISNHATGRAIDINPLLNPYIKGKSVMPEGATYDPKQPGTIAKESFIVKLFVELGWDWGGNWDDRKDYQHFEKTMRKK